MAYPASPYGDTINPAAQADQVSESAVVAEEQSPTPGTNQEMEEVTSCEQFAKLEQQVYADNRVSVVTR